MNLDGMSRILECLVQLIVVGFACEVRKEDRYAQADSTEGH